MTTTSVRYIEIPAREVTVGAILQATHGDREWGAVYDATHVPADPDGYEVDPIAPFAPAVRIRTEHPDMPDRTRYFGPDVLVRVVR